MIDIGCILQKFMTWEVSQTSDVELTADESDFETMKIQEQSTDWK